MKVSILMKKSNVVFNSISTVALFWITLVLIYQLATTTMPLGLVLIFITFILLSSALTMKIYEDVRGGVEELQVLLTNDSVSKLKEKSND